MSSTLFLRRGGSLRRWPQFYAGLPRLRKPNRNCLFGVLDAVFPFSDVMDLLAHELPRLGGRRLAFASILAGAFDGLLFGHGLLLRNLPYPQSSGCTLGNLSGK